jgi:ATP-dependent Lon protease
MNLSFNTDEKINFKEFYFTETLKEITKESVGYKQFSKKNSLNSLYSKFQNQKVNKVVLKEIKRSLI